MGSSAGFETTLVSLTTLRAGRAPADPWRRRMTRMAESLRRLDPVLFEPQIAKIEEYLRQDASWSLEAAIASYDRNHPHTQ